MKIGIHYEHVSRGPGKVLGNLISGLNNIDVEYSLNSDGDKNIILQDCPRLRGDLSNCLLGPNIATLPIDNDVLMRSDSCYKIIVPSQWVKNLYSRWIPANKISVWPVGIDTDFFKDSKDDEKQFNFLVYYKRRSEIELSQVLSFLERKNKSFTIIRYGDYSEDHFLNSIKASKMGIVISGTESQGIAIQEMLSCNLPLLVWDVKDWQDRGLPHSCPATSIPYWDALCGEYFLDLNELENTYERFMSGEYEPRKFILENLSLNSQAQKIISLWTE
jgi:hypothetical protein